MPTGRTHHPVHLAASRSRIRRSSPHRSLGRRAGAIGLCIVAAIALLPGSSVADPTPAKPTIEEVQAQVDALYEEGEVATETANDAKVRADEVRGNLDTLRSNLERLQADFEDATADAGAFAAAQYRSAGFDPSVQLLLSDDGDSFLSRMSQLDHLSGQQARAVTDLAAARSAMAQQELAIERETVRLDSLVATTADAEAAADASLQEANDLLDRLTAEEAARLAAARAAEEAAAAEAAAAAAAAEEDATPQDDGDSGGDGESDSPPPPPSGPASGRAKIAVDTAMAQIGDAYVYGAAGPNAFDCSGLTSYAWAAAGVSLPHSSRAQMGSGTSVSSNQLQPGDLVFYYSPVSHVAMYIGGGMIVHASNPSRPVGVAGVFSMPYSGAVRVG